ncbi:MAG: hypothetical protein ACI9D1_002177, partial [Cryomorphaceae bacterium]
MGAEHNRRVKEQLRLPASLFVFDRFVANFAGALLIAGFGIDEAVIL